MKCTGRLRTNATDPVVGGVVGVVGKGAVWTHLKPVKSSLLRFRALHRKSVSYELKPLDANIMDKIRRKKNTGERERERKEK